MDVAQFCTHRFCDQPENVEGHYCLFISPQSDGCLPDHRMDGLDSQYYFN